MIPVPEYIANASRHVDSGKDFRAVLKVNEGTVVLVAKHFTPELV
jgi:hypothetical protein